MCGTSLQPRKGGNPAPHLAFITVGGGEGGATLSLWCLAGGVWYCLKVFCVAGLLCCPLNREQALVGDFFFFVHTCWHFQLTNFITFKSRIHLGKRKPKELMSVLFHESSSP